MISISNQTISYRCLDIRFGTIQSACKKWTIARLEMDVITRKDWFFASRSNHNAHISFVWRLIFWKTCVLGKTKNSLSGIEFAYRTVKSANLIDHCLWEIFQSNFRRLVFWLMRMHSFDRIVCFELFEKGKNGVHGWNGEEVEGEWRK